YFKFILDRMITPDTSIDIHAFPFQNIFREGIVVPVYTPFAFCYFDFGRRGESLASVQPSIGSPMQAVYRLVAIAYAPACEPDLKIIHVCLVVLVPVGDKDEVGRGAEEEAVETHGDRRRKSDSLQEYLAGVGFPVAVHVFENEDAAFSGVRKSFSARFVVFVLCDP